MHNCGIRNAGGRLAFMRGDISNPPSLGVEAIASECERLSAVTTPSSHSTPTAHSVATRCNWRFLDRGADAANRAVHTAAGGDLTDLSVKVMYSQTITTTLNIHSPSTPPQAHKAAKVAGKAYPVELPTDNSFRRVDGVRWVINVLGMAAELLLPHPWHITTLMLLHPHRSQHEPTAR